MSTETNPSESAPPPRKAPSEAQLAANRSNALLSTGPRSLTGKANSSRNSIKHGFCSLIADVPGEDPDLYQARFDAWRPGLNPGGDEFGDYLLSLTVRSSLSLDRIHVAQTARSARRARRASKARASDRARDVERLLRKVPQLPDITVRRLRETPEGCRALFQEWKYLRAALILPANWDKDDAFRALCLLGQYTTSQSQASAEIMIPTKALELHREIQRKLLLNSRDHIDWTVRYSSTEAHQIDKDRIDHLEADSRDGVAWITALADRTEAELLERAAEMDEVERIEDAEAGLRERVDTTDEGKLMHRYAMDQQRSLLKLAKAVQERSEAAADAAQVIQSNAVLLLPAIIPSSGPAPLNSRNEANPGDRREPLRASNPGQPTPNRASNRDKRRTKGRPDRR